MVEFKRNVNSDLAKELVAFANAAGGRVFIGIEDDGSLVGSPFTNEISTRVQMMARDCDPVITDRTIRNDLEFLTQNGWVKSNFNAFSMRSVVPVSSVGYITTGISNYFRNYTRIMTN